MSLKRRLLILLYSAALLAVLGGVPAVYFVVTPAYFDIEESAARSEVARVEAAFMQELTTLQIRARDWVERPEVQALVAGEAVQLVAAAGELPRGVEVQRLSAGAVQGAFAIRDYRDETLMQGTVTLDRGVYGRGLRAQILTSLALLLVALVAVTLVHAYVSRVVFRRLERMRDTVQRIAQGGNLDLRLRVPGNDELSALAADFNRMVDSIKDSQRSLAAASERAESANRAKSLFLANMSHEIRTPMTAILGYTELLENPALSQEDRRRYLSVVQQNGDALMALISDVLDLSRIEAGQMRVERQRCALPSLMKELIYSHRLKATEKGIRLVLEYRTAVPSHVSTDPFRLRQVLGNLIGNAIKFTDEGSVTVRVSWEDGLQSCLHVDVVDTGIGMSAEALERVFEPFSQEDDSHTRRYGGSGLGLSIARQLARSLGGDIYARSRPGEGSSFHVFVKMLADSGAAQVQPPQALLAEVSSQQLPAIQVGGRVLLVEDNEVNRLLVLDGYMAAAAMRELGYAGPILALTANVMAEDRRRCLAAGCDDFLGKPVRAARLLSVCSRLISRGRASSPATMPGVADRG